MFGKSTEASIPKARKVCGYEIKKMPIGRYLQVMEDLQDFPALAIEAVFPDMTFEQILQSLKDCNGDTLGQMLVRAMGVVPREAVALLARMTDIPEEELLQNESIGLDGLVMIIEAWVEVNRLENFMNAARRVIGKIRSAAANGSKS
jgi:hypothetical protein